MAAWGKHSSALQCQQNYTCAQAMRFGNDLEACLKAIQIGFELSHRPSDTVYQGAVKTLEMVSWPCYSPILCPCKLAGSCPTAMSGAQEISCTRCSTEKLFGFLTGLQEAQKGLQGRGAASTDSAHSRSVISHVSMSALLCRIISLFVGDGKL